MWKLNDPSANPADAMNTLRRQAVRLLADEIAALTAAPSKLTGKALPSARRVVRFSVAGECVGGPAGEAFCGFERRAADRLESLRETVERPRTLHGELAQVVEAAKAATISSDAWFARLNAVAPDFGPPRMDRNGLADGRVYRLVEALSEARSRAKLWPCADSFDTVSAALLPGLKTLYRRCRAAAIYAARHPDAPAAKWALLDRHTARLAEALRWIEAAWPEGLKPQRKAAGALSRLARALAHTPALAAAIPEPGFHDVLKKYRQKTHAEALRLAHGALADSPAQWGGFLQRRLDRTGLLPAAASRPKQQASAENRTQARHALAA
ncbi:MAG: hypothetical protein AAF288_09505 [Planctomycetota bacterium]